MSLFSKGHIPWNKNLKGAINSGSFKVGHKQLNSGRTWWTKEKVTNNAFIENRNPKLLRGENHPLWSGRHPRYHALHMWVKSHYGKATICQKCGSIKNIEWSNISYKYLRDRSDWQMLCKSCHVNYDRMHGWGKATKKINSERKNIYDSSF